MMKRIGITGGVGCGKSRVLEYLASHQGCSSLKADEVAHRVKEKGGACYGALVSLLGEGVLGADGDIDRGKMAELIFADKALLRQVNALIHPAVQDYMMEAMEKQEGTEVFFLEAALLIEAGYPALLDELWYIYSDEESRKKRLQQSRGYSEKKIRTIMDSQLKEEDYRRAAHVVIDNSGDFADTVRQLKREMARLTQRMAL